jgi:hypothetical protein
MASDRFEYACWQLTENGKPDALRKELKRLEGTSTGEQIVRAQRLLAEHDEANEATSGI